MKRHVLTGASRLLSMLLCLALLTGAVSVMAAGAEPRTIRETAAPDWVREPDADPLRIPTSGDCGGEDDGTNLHWQVSGSKLIITGEGKMADYRASKQPWRASRGKITTLSIGTGVTSVGSYAFYDLPSLTAVPVPGNVETIGDYAFAECPVLETVTVRDGVQSIGEGAFSECVSLKTASLPESVTELSEILFLHCEDMTTATFSSAVTDIGSSAFEGCTALRRVTLPDTLRTIGDYAFAEAGLSDVTVPGDAEMGEGVFEKCEQLTSAVLSDGIPAVKNRTFNGCIALATVRLPDSVTVIGDQAFTGCESLTEAVLPRNLTAIGDRAFNGCESLTEMTIPAKVTSIGDQAFCFTKQLTGFAVEEGNTAFSVRGGVLYDAEETTLIQYPGGLANDGFDIPGTVTTVEPCAFAACEHINGAIYIPAGVTAIGARAFMLCLATTAYEVSDNNPSYSSDEAGILYNKDQTVLLQYPCASTAEELAIPDGVTEIGDYAFAGTAALSELTVPTSVTDIGAAAFQDCLLTDVYYAGQKSQWDAIRISSGNDALTNATLHMLLAVTKQPEDAVVTLDENATFTVEAAGDGALTYQWQYKTASGTIWRNSTIAGSDSDTLTIQATKAREGMSFRCRIVDSEDAEVTTDAAKLITKPKILVDPRDVTVAAGAKASFSVEADGVGELSYQWQFQPKNYTTRWYDSSAEVDENGTVTIDATEARDGQKYRCVVTHGNGQSAESEAATLHVTAAPKITPLEEGQENLIVVIGETATLHVDVVGAEVLTYQWYVKKGDADWAEAEDDGAKTDTMTFPAEAERNGEQFYCKVTDANDNSAESQVQTLKVKLKITQQPVNQEAHVDEVTTSVNVTFHVGAEGVDPLTYRWQYQPKDYEERWYDSAMTGSNTDTMTVAATEDRDGQKYRCVITDPNGFEEISEVATLSVSTGPYISSPTEDVEYDAATGEPVTFSVTATGLDLSYQWQYSSDNGANWRNSGYSSAKTATLSFNAEKRFSGYLYRCVVTDVDGKQAISKTFKLTVAELKITTQPESVVAALGDYAVYSIVAAPNDSVTYQWQYKTAAGTTWRNSTIAGARTDTLSIQATEARDGLSFRCVVSDNSGNKLTSDEVTLGVKPNVVITADPANATMPANQNVTFTAAAEGIGTLDYQWQVLTKATDDNPSPEWTDLPDENAQTLTVTATEEIDGWQYRCVVGHTGNEHRNESNAITLRCTARPQITPLAEGEEIVSVTVGETASFTVEATGVEPLTYQWQYSADGGQTWTKSGYVSAKTKTLTFTADVKWDSYQYRCMVTDKNKNSACSEPQTLKVKLKITQQPQDVTIHVDETTTTLDAVFTVKAVGVGLTYQWQQLIDGEWTDLEGKTAATLTIAATEDSDGQQYRCIVRDANENEETTDAVTLSVDTQIHIITQPVSVSANVGDSVSFSVEASGISLSYQWQYKTPDGDWADSRYGTAKTKKLTFTAKAEYSGYQYRCQITDVNDQKAYTDVVTLTVGSLRITKQPANVTVEAGKTATFTITAEGTGLTYQWQYKSPTGSWTNSNGTGSKTAKLTFAAKASFNNYQYRCVVKDASGKSVTSNAAKLTVTETQLRITTQPKNVEGFAGDTATFTVAAVGKGTLSYQWQYQPEGYTTWYNSTANGAKTASLSIGITDARNGQKYRCVVSDSTGASVESNAATLSVVDPTLRITGQPTDYTGAVGTTATFTVTAVGRGLSYQWQYQPKNNTGESNWWDSGSVGAKTATLSIEVKASRDGQKYRCIVTDQDGNVVTSNTVTIHIG